MALSRHPRAVGLTEAQAHQEGFRNDEKGKLAGKVKLKDSWPDSYKGNTILITSETGFSTVQTGIYTNGEFYHDPYTGQWTSTDEGDCAWIRHAGFFDNTSGRVLNRKTFAFSVRFKGGVYLGPMGFMVLSE
jgi:hypothetical protein